MGRRRDVPSIVRRVSSMAHLVAFDELAELAGGGRGRHHAVHVRAEHGGGVLLRVTEAALLVAERRVLLQPRGEVAVPPPLHLLDDPHQRLRARARLSAW